MDTHNGGGAAGEGAPDVIAGGKYIIQRKLGSGGMGIVFEASHVELGRRVAIKMMHPKDVGSAEDQVRFRREAQACASITHPNVVEVFDFGFEGARAYIVMPKLEGESLEERVAREERLPPAEGVGVAAQVLDGLHAAHELGLVHRDVKPANVFLVRVDGATSAKVLDFGIARSLTPDGEGSLTGEGLPMGTPRYMAPEQAQGRRDIDRRADVYAVGVTLYRMLAGRSPFEADGVMSVLAAVAEGRFEKLSQRMPDLPVGLGEVVDRAMALDREARFGSAKEFRDALRPYLAEAAPLHDQNAKAPQHPNAVFALPAPTPPPSSRPGWNARRGARALVLLCAAAGLAAVVGAGWSSPPASPVDAHPRPSETRVSLPERRADGSTVAAPAVTVRPPAGGGPGAPPQVTPAAPPTAAPRRRDEMMVVVVAEDGDKVSAPGTGVHVVARQEYGSELARARLRVPRGTARVCCRDPLGRGERCVAVRSEGGEGRANCIPL